MEVLLAKLAVAFGILGLWYLAWVRRSLKVLGLAFAVLALALTYA